MRPQRRLVLRHENLTLLDSDDMRSVVGATHIPTDCGCVTHGFSCEACPIPTLPVNDCVNNVVESIRYCIVVDTVNCTT